MRQQEHCPTRSTVTKATIHPVWFRCSPPQWGQLTHNSTPEGGSDRQMEVWEAVNNLPQNKNPISVHPTASVTFITMHRVCVYTERETWPAWEAEGCLTKTDVRALPAVQLTLQRAALERNKSKAQDRNKFATIPTWLQHISNAPFFSMLLYFCYAVTCYCCFS